MAAEMRLPKRSAGRALTAAALALAAVIAAALCGCSSEGVPLCTVSRGGREYEAYGTVYGVSGVKVTEDGSPVAMIRVGKRFSDEPYSDSDGLNYGMTVDDVDLDGYDDIVVQIGRSPGAELYRFFFGNGLTYTAGTLFDGFKGAVFGRGDGLIGRTYETTLWYIRSETNPDVYERVRTTEWWTRGRDGGFAPVSGETLTYYSDQDIYCHALCVYDAETGELVPEQERWLTADGLAAAGLEPFGPLSE